MYKQWRKKEEKTLPDGGRVVVMKKSRLTEGNMVWVGGEIPVPATKSPHHPREGGW